MTVSPPPHVTRLLWIDATEVGRHAHVSAGLVHLQGGQGVQQEAVEREAEQDRELQAGAVRTGRARFYKEHLSIHRQEARRSLSVLDQER